MSLDIFVEYPPCEHCGSDGHRINDVLDYGEEGRLNCTHNLRKMWLLAGCYEALYCSEGVKAASLLPTLRQALAHMQDNPKEYLPLNPPNGWGSYEGAVKFLGRVIATLARHPNALVRSCP